VPSQENERISGTGLGLTLVQHIAEAHEGRVEVRSEPGKGSTFSLFLPLDGVAA
jgi:two-component system phosphate regulon sensor histidine kinase PhoR